MICYHINQCPPELHKIQYEYKSLKQRAIGNALVASIGVWCCHLFIDVKSDLGAVALFLCTTAILCMVFVNLKWLVAARAALLPMDADEAACLAFKNAQAPQVETYIDALDTLERPRVPTRGEFEMLMSDGFVYESPSFRRELYNFLQSIMRPLQAGMK